MDALVNSCVVLHFFREVVFASTAQPQKTNFTCVHPASVKLQNHGFALVQGHGNNICGYVSLGWIFPL